MGTNRLAEVMLGLGVICWMSLGSMIMARLFFVGRPSPQPLLRWIELGRPPGRQVYAYLVLAAITVFIGGIAARTLVALHRRQLLPSPPVQFEMSKA